MQKHWLHPLNLLVVLVVAATIAMLSIETFFSFGNTLARLNQSTMATASEWRWAHIISATFWVIGFSAGIVGAMVNLSHAIRLRSAVVNDFSAVGGLSVGEVKELNLWLDSNTYGPEHLKGLWKEDVS